MRSFSPYRWTIAMTSEKVERVLWFDTTGESNTKREAWLIERGLVMLSLVLWVVLISTILGVVFCLIGWIIGF